MGVEWELILGCIGWFDVGGVSVGCGVGGIGGRWVVFGRIGGRWVGIGDIVRLGISRVAFWRQVVPFLLIT